MTESMTNGENPEHGSRGESRAVRLEERLGFLEHELESLAESVRGLIARCDTIERATSRVYSRLAERVESLEESVPDAES